MFLIKKLDEWNNEWNNDLFNAEVGVSGSDCFSIVVWQRVEHRMVRMDRRQTVALQLLADNVD